MSDLTEREKFNIDDNWLIREVFSKEMWSLGAWTVGLILSFSIIAFRKSVIQLLV